MLTPTQKTDLGLKSPLEGLAYALNQKRGAVRLVYDFAVQGGAVGSLTLKDSDGNDFQLPAGAIITQGYLSILTACVSTGNNGTIALTAESAGDLLAAVDADTKAAITALIPTGTAATMVRCTAARRILLAIATNALTAGKFEVFLEYVLGGT